MANNRQAAAVPVILPNNDVWYGWEPRGEAGNSLPGGEKGDPVEDCLTPRDYIQDGKKKTRYECVFDGEAFSTKGQMEEHLRLRHGSYLRSPEEKAADQLMQDIEMSTRLAQVEEK